MKTKYEEIVNVNAIGKAENPISLNEILKKANDEQLTPSKQNKERVLFIGIDVQQDFMDGGALGVSGAHGDVERMTRFIYNNMDKISNIAVSIDTHTPHQIFHPCWWIDENGNNPAPYTPITLADLDSGKMEGNYQSYGKPGLCGALGERWQENALRVVLPLHSGNDRLCVGKSVLQHDLLPFRSEKERCAEAR